MKYKKSDAKAYARQHMVGVWAASLAFLAAHAWLACELACAGGGARSTAAKRAGGPVQKHE